MSLIDKKLKEILVCPADKGGLTEDEAGQVLKCDVCGRSFPVKHGIPVMLIDETADSIHEKEREGEDD